MKRLIASALLLGGLSAPALADPSPACVAKRTYIENQIAEAKANNRTEQVEGLQRALKANKANCTDESLAKEREEDIRDAQEEVAERERDLAEAKREGDADKIAKRQEKLNEARQELEEARKPIGR